MARPDWNKLRAEYIAGGISQRKLAEKYNVSFNTLKDKANKEKWAKQQEETYNKATTKAQQKTVEAAASNAVKLEKARGLAIERCIRALEQMPVDTGSRSRKTLQDGKKTLTVDYSLLDIVSALEKLTKLSATEQTGGNELLESIYAVIAKGREDG